jgi:hypothetical protein
MKKVRDDAQATIPGRRVNVVWSSGTELLHPD